MTAIPQTGPAATVAEVLAELTQVAGRLPLLPEPEATARILDRLSEELAQAAAMLRQAPAQAERDRLVDAAQPMRAVTKKLEGSGLQIRQSPRELLITNPEDPDKGCVYVSLENPADPYLAWQHTTYEFWNLDDPEHENNAALIAEKITQLLAS